MARYQGTARLMFNSFGSSLWMLPSSKYCRSDNALLKHFSPRSKKGHFAYVCDDHEFQVNYSGWPTNLINVEIPSVRGSKCSISRTHSFTSFCTLLWYVWQGMLTLLHYFLCRRWSISFTHWNCTDQCVWRRMWISNSVILFCSWSFWRNVFQSYSWLWSWH